MSTDDATSTARFGAGARVQVLLPLALDEAYDYRVPESLTLAEGDFVRVPLGRRELSGVVWGAAEGHVPESRIKDVAARVAAPPLGLAMRRFIAWVAGYTLAPRGAVLRMAMSVPAALTPPRPTTAYVIPPGAVTASTTRLTPARRRLLAVLAEGPPRAAAELAREAGVGASVVRDMAAAGLLQAVTIETAGRPPMPDWRAPAPALSPEQAAAASRLEPRVAKGGFHVALLDGVPGAGKTEVYFHAVARALEAGRQVLVMLPEIALGAQWLARFRDRFGATPVEWHSDLTPARRCQAWRWVAEGQARVVVGARSALFLPFPELGLIVVDEEHDPSFKQEEGVVYNARDMAVVRGRLENVPVVLVSATPSLESVINVQGGRYRGLHLPDRFAGALLPAVDLVDMRGGRASARTWLSPALTAALAETLANREQAMLFLNRRGYAPLTLCRVCGHRIRCPSCTAWLVEHRRIGKLQCHHCGYTTGLPDACPACNQKATLAACGPGVERLAEEVAAGFPDARLAIAASDTLTGPRAAAELVRRIEDHDIDIVVGTQIVAKGYHFPLLTLVGVVDADIGLAGGDLRAAERTYQLLYQVAGRAGRADRPGRVLVQTYMPDNAVMRALASGDRDRFLAAEADDRRRSGMPPFGRLAALVVAGRDEPATDAAARALARCAPRAPGLQVLGPAPAPMALLRGWHRRRLLVKATREIVLQPILKGWLAQVRLAGKVRVQVDIDPMSFL